MAKLFFPVPALIQTCFKLSIKVNTSELPPTSGCYTSNLSGRRESNPRPLGPEAVFEFCYTLLYVINNIIYRKEYCQALLSKIKNLTFPAAKNQKQAVPKQPAIQDQSIMTLGVRLVSRMGYYQFNFTY
jgi:hypothetical protein